MTALRIIFMGTAELACASLSALLGSPLFQVFSVVTQPDRPKGRDLKLHPSPVKELALRAGVPVLQPERAREETFIQTIRATQPDLIVVAAYGQILPRSLLEAPRYGCVNVHTSLLPKYRGAAPIQWAILNDETETGVTIMKMDVGLDTGDILTQERTPILPDDTSATLHDRLAETGANLLVRTLPEYVAGRIAPTPQPAEGACYASKISKQDGLIDWAQPARALWNRVRGLTPWPGAFTFLPAHPQRAMLKIWEAEVVDLSGSPSEVLQVDKNGIVVGCGQQALRILSLQREGGKRLAPREFLAGHPLAHSTRLG
jgi:methionyl-tRNA formyltransferase